MQLSMKWLKDYVDIDIAPKEFAEDMTMSGSKVETFEEIGGEITGVVVGKILSIERHPDADKLVVCSIDVGKETPLQIVTGASNVSVGDIIPVCTDGATLPGGKVIKKGKLRGVVSEGMLCSLSELGLTKNDFPYAIEDGIFIMQEDCEIGQDIHLAIGLDDVSVEFEITPNRPDCLSVIGLARETAATYKLPMKEADISVKGSGDDISNYVSVSVKDGDLCPRYMAKVVKNVKIAPSPRWMRERLRASGVRPINNIVDITNYVMIEYGQPMHAFDYRLIGGKEIIVRRAEKGESIVTLDGVTRELNEKMLVIADSTKPVAIGGVMGGENSGIVEDTVTVVFESANFNGPSIRNTSRALGLRTDASGKYEKGLDAENCLPALLRACHLVEELGAGEVVDGMIDVKAKQFTPTVIKFDPDWINRFLGTDVSVEDMQSILNSLSFKIDGDDITVPSWRSDVEHKADIAEEIARFYGYNKIPSTLMKGQVTVGGLNARQQFEEKVADYLASIGMDEIMTYSFISPKYYDKIMLPEDSEKRDSVIITNPLGEDTSVMRTTVLPSMLEVLARNYNNRNAAAALFEMGTVYSPVKTEVSAATEKKILTLGAYGEGDFFSLKGKVIALLDTLGVGRVDWESTVDASYHPGRLAKITKDGVLLGIMGEVHPLVLKNYGIDTAVIAAELDVNAVYSVANASPVFKALPKFPAVTRDIAVVCEDMLPVAKLEECIRKGAGNLLEKVELFDVYRGAQIGEGNKSVAYALTLRAEDRTLTEDEINAKMKKIVKLLGEIGATQRA